MKKNRILRLGLLALALTLVTGSLVSGTFAKYVTTVTGTGTVTVAKWDVQLGHNAQVGDNVYTEAIAFNMFEKSYDGSGVDGELLAPGTSGSFEFTYDTSDTEVAHNVTIKLEQTDGTIDLDTLDFLTFTVVGGTVGGVAVEPFKAAKLIDGVVILSKDIQESAGTSGNTVTVNWVWPYEKAAGDAGNDLLDTADGVTPITDAEITVTFTATQLDS